MKHINIINTNSNYPHSVEMIADSNYSTFVDSGFSSSKIVVPNIPLSNIRSFFYLFVIIIRIYRSFIINKGNIINIYHCDNMYTCLASFFTPKNILTHTHFNNEFYETYPNILYRFAIIKSKYFICISNFSKHNLEEYLIKIGTNPKKKIYYTLYPNLQVENHIKKFNKSKTYSVSKRLDVINLLYVGSEGGDKNISQIIEVISILTNKGYKICFIKCGLEKSPKNIERMIKNFNIKNIVFEFYHDISPLELCEIYKRSDIFISCSKIEGFGMPIAEAMYFGLPVVCSDIPVFHEILGDLGMFASNTQEFVNHIISLSYGVDGIQKKLVSRCDSMFSNKVRKKKLISLVK